MLIQLIIALIVGVSAGTITGLIPGVHINLVAALILAFVSAPIFPNLSPIIFVVFIIAMSIMHSFVDFIPAIFLGAPDEDTILSILPGHKMLKKGRAHEAVLLTLVGSSIAIVFVLLISPLFILFLPKIYPYIKTIMPFILLLASIFLIFSEKNSRLFALLIFFLAGFLGIATLNLPIKQPFLPLLTGLFGSSALILSIKNKIKIPKQKIITIKKLNLKKKEILNAGLGGIIASPLCSFLPGLGSGQAAVIGSEVVGDMSQREFLILLGMINTIVISLSFVTLYTINKARTGVAVAVSKILPALTTNNLILILVIILISGTITFFMAIFLSKRFSLYIQKVDYTILSYIILSILLAIVLSFSGFLGLLVFIISTFLGLSAISSGIKRIHLMGCLLLPTILFYLL